jgi:hypothetical protein
MTGYIIFFSKKILFNSPFHDRSDRRTGMVGQSVHNSVALHLIDVQMLNEQWDAGRHHQQNHQLGLGEGNQTLGVRVVLKVEQVSQNEPREEESRLP